MTLAGHAYNHMVTHEQSAYSSPIEVLLELVDRMPAGIAFDGRSYRVSNPALTTENFADRWNSDGGVRVCEFTWHRQLAADLEALFNDEFSKKNESHPQRLWPVRCRCLEDCLNAQRASRPSSRCSWSATDQPVDCSSSRAPRTLWLETGLLG